MVRRRQRERSLFEVLLPDGDKLWPAWLKRIDQVLEDDAVIDTVVTALEHKQALFVWLKQQWADLFHADLSVEDRKALVKKLLEARKGECFICEKKLDPDLHGAQIDIDHVEPLKVGGKDDPSNFAATHASCNRSKQASDLRVARVLARFASIKDEVSEEGRGPNLGDVLARNGGAKHELALRRNKDAVQLSFAEVGDNTVYTVPLYRDALSGLATRCSASCAMPSASDL